MEHDGQGFRVVGHQRAESVKHAEEIKKYLEQSENRGEITQASEWRGASGGRAASGRAQPACVRRSRNSTRQRVERQGARRAFAFAPGSPPGQSGQRACLHRRRAGITASTPPPLLAPCAIERGTTGVPRRGVSPRQRPTAAAPRCIPRGPSVAPAPGEAARRDIKKPAQWAGCQDQYGRFGYAYESSP